MQNPLQMKGILHIYLILYDIGLKILLDVVIPVLYIPLRDEIRWYRHNQWLKP